MEGTATGQIKIQVSHARDKNDKSPPTYFSTQAITDNEGKFLLPKRLPPGRYQIQGMQSNGNALISLLAMQKSTKVFLIPPGKPHHSVTVDVPVFK